MRKLSVYIHIPFCERKCLYCDFVSFKCETKLVDKYLDTLISEINSFDSSDYVVDSIFFGGGTPTLLNDKQFKKIVDCVKEHFTTDIAEFTVEGNPNSYTLEKVNLYKSLGVTRLSVGVQSLNDKVLKGIGRVHNSQQAKDCLSMLVKSGLDINCDMMVGLPYQTLDIVRNDIKQIVDFGVNSVSCYSLILEEGTPLFENVHKGFVTLSSEDLTVDMYDLCANILQKSGLNMYEISNFGKPCLHNMGYWTMKEYVGFGLSAHSLIGNTRYYNTSDFSSYLNGECHHIEEVLSTLDMQNEYIMLALRTADGIQIEDFTGKFGGDLNSLLKKLDNDKKYYNINDNCISIKPEYIYLSNGLIANLL